MLVKTLAAMPPMPLTCRFGGVGVPTNSSRGEAILDEELLSLLMGLEFVSKAIFVGSRLSGRLLYMEVRAVGPLIQLLIEAKNLSTCSLLMVWSLYET